MVDLPLGRCDGDAVGRLRLTPEEPRTGEMTDDSVSQPADDPMGGGERGMPEETAPGLPGPSRLGNDDFDDDDDDFDDERDVEYVMPRDEA